MRAVVGSSWKGRWERGMERDKMLIAKKKAALPDVFGSLKIVVPVLKGVSA